MVSFIVSIALFLSAQAVSSEQFTDTSLALYEVPEWEKLPLKQKTLAFCLSRAGLALQDVYLVQNHPQNLVVMRTLTAIMKNYSAPHDDNHKKFEEYVKAFWRSKGMHHHFYGKKIKPNFSADYLKEIILAIKPELLPLNKHETKDEFCVRVIDLIFSKNIAKHKIRKVNNNYSLYAPLIGRVVYWLEKAIRYALTEEQVLKIKAEIAKFKGEEVPTFEAEVKNPIDFVFDLGGYAIHTIDAKNEEFQELNSAVVGWLEKVAPHYTPLFKK